MDTVELFQRMSAAIAIGLLIGLERGWRAREDREGQRAAGLRTHALAALLGAVWGAISNQAGIGGAVSLGLAFGAFSVAIILFRYRETEHGQTFGATTVVAAMLVFGLGAFAVVGDMLALPLGIAAITLAAAGAIFMRRAVSTQESERPLHLTNPLGIVMVLKFALFLTVVAVLAKLATNVAGSAGALTASQLSPALRMSTRSRFRWRASVEAGSSRKRRRERSPLPSR